MGVNISSVLLLLLASVAVLHSVDKIGFSLLLPSIAQEMRLNDSQIGLLGGPAFAVLNAVAALPLARCADRMGRLAVLALCLAAWSALTMLAGAARGLGVLLCLRVCIGIAEAGASPASQSLLAAAVPPARRGGAFAVLLGGSYLGIVLGLWAGGLLVQALGWRGACLCLGAPGLALALCLPAATTGTARAAPPSPRAAWTMVKATATGRRFIHLTATVASASIAGWGISAWLPSFYSRHFHMAPGAIGFWLGIALGLGAMAGALIGGLISRRLGRGGNPGSLWPSFWATLASVPFLTLAFATSNQAVSLACLMISTILGSILAGPVYAAVQDLATPATRATVAALFGAIVVLVGQGCGPLLIGIVSDLARHAQGTDGLRFSLLCVSLVGIWPAAHLLILARQPNRPAVS